MNETLDPIAHVRRIPIDHTAVQAFEVVPVPRNRSVTPLTREFQKLSNYTIGQLFGVTPKTMAQQVVEARARGADYMSGERGRETLGVTCYTSMVQTRFLGSKHLMVPHEYMLEPIGATLPRYILLAAFVDAVRDGQTLAYPAGKPEIVVAGWLDKRDLLWETRQSALTHFQSKLGCYAVPVTQLKPIDTLKF